jgi:tripartite-type tricarboxylate transporter receptor subunit TctC
MGIFRCCVVVAATSIALIQCQSAQAQNYPTRPVTLIAPWPPGGAVDTLCRILGAKLSDRLGTNVIIENRPGAGSVLGVGMTARAAPDGYTLVMAGSASLATSVTIYKKLAYDPTKDFTPIALITRIPFVLVVNPSLPVQTAVELVSLAKRRPGHLSYASGGAGSPHHLYTELLMSMAGLEMTHVPYKGSAPALSDVAAGHVPLMLGDIVASLPLARDGKVRALGVSSLTRVPVAPELPTIAETAVPGFEGVGWVMIVGPANMPKAIVNRLHAEFKAVAAMPDIQQQLIKFGTIPVDSPSPERQQHFINSEIARWAPVVQRAGMAGSQ